MHLNPCARSSKPQTMPSDLQTGVREDEFGAELWAEYIPGDHSDLALLLFSLRLQCGAMRVCNSCVKSVFMQFCLCV